MQLFSRRHALVSLGLAVLSGAARGAPLAAVVGAKELRFAVYKDFAPWSYRQDGRLTGVDVAIAQALAARIGVPATFTELAAGESVDDDLRNGVWRGSLVSGVVADVMLHIPVDKGLAARNGKALIGAPYYREQFQLASREDCSDGPAALDGLKIGVELDSAPDFFLLGVHGGKYRSHVIHFPDGAMAAAAMARGEVDAVLATRAQVQQGLRGYGGPVSYYDGALPGLGRTSWPVGLAVRADSGDLLARLNQDLASLTADGRLAGIFQAYGVSYAAPAAA